MTAGRRGTDEAVESHPPGGVVLVVDDEPDIRNVARRVLGKITDAPILEAGTVAEAVAQLSTAEVAVLFVDLGLPDGPG
ncbi:histidine kinase, partial [Nodularia spumigena CH309]|nr:histidine kinase [Nodularia spumigena CH309]